MKQLLPQLVTVHQQIMLDNKECKDIDITIFSQLYHLSYYCRTITVWTIYMSDRLQIFISNFKMNLVNRFGDTQNSKIQILKVWTMNLSVFIVVGT